MNECTLRTPSSLTNPLSVNNIAFKLRDKKQTIEKLEVLRMLQYYWRETQNMFLNLDNKDKDIHKVTENCYWFLGNIIFVYKHKCLKYI